MFCPYNNNYVEQLLVFLLSALMVFVLSDRQLANWKSVRFVVDSVTSADKQ